MPPKPGRLRDSVTKGGVCESLAVTAAADITRFGGWLAYLRAQA